MKVQEKIRTLRTNKGWTQENMAEMLGLSINGYSNIERGETDLTLQRLEQIAKLFEMSYLDLLNNGEKQGFYFSGNHNNQNSCNHIYTDKDLAQEVEKLRLQNQFLEKENANLQEIIRLLKKNIE